MTIILTNKYKKKCHRELKELSLVPKYTLGYNKHMSCMMKEKGT